MNNQQAIANNNFWLILIIILAVVLRVCWLGEAPNTFSTDEASDGYDAYSILLTGRDRYGDYLPIILRAFNDARESLYVFLLVPLIKLFGLNEFITRFPAAVAGVLIVPVVYWLAKELFVRQKIALFAAFLTAISPWGIYYSRLTFRANLFPLFFCLGLLFFLRSWRIPNNLIFSSLFFGISLHTYSPARAFVPLFLLGLVAICYRQLIKYPVITVISVVIFLTIFLFLLQFWLSPKGMGRLEETGFETNILMLLLYYLSYLEPVFLFFYGDFNVRRSVTTIGIGELYIWEIFTVVTALLSLRTEKTIASKILFLWLFLYPIPAALIEPQHAIRAIVGMPLFALISSYGFWILYAKLSNNRQYLKKKLLLYAIALFFCYHLYAYYNYSQNKISNTGIGHWQYGMGEALAYAEQYTEKNNNQCVIVSNQFKRVNMYILFYTKYSPAEYQKDPHDPEMKYFDQPTQLGKYTIANIREYKSEKSNCLYIIQPEELSSFKQKYPQSQEMKQIKTPQNISKIIIKLSEWKS
jgi:4-amino-4-deoxy-L-arabinose transferase-like glycosyltransferase